MIRRCPTLFLLVLTLLEASGQTCDPTLACAADSDCAAFGSPSSKCQISNGEVFGCCKEEIGLTCDGNSALMCFADADCAYTGVSNFKCR
ncbi:hypothetical protein PFISCL1PPCAC_10832, partial [Pristionchus fissidentatus]